MNTEQKNRMMERLRSAMAAMRTDSPGGSGGSSKGVQQEIRNAGAGEIARRISQFVQKPVVDLTALPGKYDMDLQILQAAGDSPEHAASQALAAFGLKLEAQKVPVHTIVVDSASKTPTEN